MNKKYKLGIIGCGDYLRCETANLQRSQLVEVKSLFDTDLNRANKYAEIFGAKPVPSADAILEDPAIDLVLLFVPPWARKDLLLRAVQAQKHVLTTKPLGPTVADCQAMFQAVEQTNRRCGVLYIRSGNSQIETLKSLLESGEVGKLALVRHDWIHHYPQWNQWALDPARNGGPFMDAEIHNLNFTRYLMGRPATQAAFFSDNLAHPQLQCADTEGMKIDFKDGGTAYLFITWAADLRVDSLDGNYREHIDVTYFVTDQGWRLTLEKAQITATKEGTIKTFPITKLSMTIYDRFVQSIEKHGNMPHDIPTVREAHEDIAIIRSAEEGLGQPVILNGLV